MEEKKLIRLMELVARKTYLMMNDPDKKRIMEANPYAFREGYQTENMEEIEKIDDEIENLIKPAQS